jgi:sigma-B regulation protein RsbU (phosphoserine phosphatase)
MVVEDLFGDEVAPLHSGTVALGIRQVLCAPLRLVRYLARSDAPVEPRNIGVLYVDSRERGALLSVAARVSLDALAGQAAVAIENARLYQEAIEKGRLDDELMMASAIQQALLPDRRRSGTFFEAVGSSVPSRAIGGDFFDYQDLGELGFGFALGDVMGKGPPAALLTSLVQGVLAARALSPSTPEDVVAIINRILLARRLESRFVTMFLAVLAPDGRLTYCNAGQNPPLLVTPGSVTPLETGGTIVGAFDDAVYERGQAQLAPGDSVVLFSDGVVEAEDGHGQQFGDERLLAAIRAAPGRLVSQAPGEAGTADAVLDAVFGAVRAFTRGAPLRDDLTAVVVRYCPDSAV